MKRTLLQLTLLACSTFLLAASSAGADGLIAPPGKCPGATRIDAPAVQKRAMLCLTEYARRAAGLEELSPAPALELSAGDKAHDILECDSFSHFACGREFTFWMRRTGYIPAPCWHVGENLAWGEDGLGAARSIFRAWMGSPEHRANLLGSYGNVGIGLDAGTLWGRPGIQVWAMHFGAHCDAGAQ